MVRIFISTLLLSIFSLCSLSQDEQTSYIGINFPSMLGTTLELGFEKNLKSNFSFDIYGGYVFNSEINGNCTKEYNGLSINKKSGAFIKIGARYNWRKNLNKLAPFIGVNIVNSLAIEEGTQENGGFINNQPTIWLEPIISNTYNLGINGIIGFTSNSTDRFNFDVGIQAGRVVIDNLMHCNSYMPGMGARYFTNSVQGIFRLKYRIQ